jgi:hypothetical protein
VKQLDLNKLNQNPQPSAANDQQGPGYPDRQAQLRQALWQLLLPLPAAGAVGPAGIDPRLAAMGGSAPSEQRSASQDARGSNKAGELAATAYLLAGHIQQLSLYDAARAEVAGAAISGRPSGSPQAISVRLEATTERGGLATVELMHPELGPIELSIELAEGAVRVTATASSARSAEVIAQGQAALAARLLRQGVALEALDVVIVRKKKDAKSGTRARARARRQQES